MISSNIITLKNPRSPISESYRTLRTNIQFSSFDKKVKTIIVTSSGPGEGKTTTSSNLAVVMAESGKKTIVIDCDQRKPNLHEIFTISNQKGLSNFLAGEVTFDEVINHIDIDNLDVLTAGTRPPNPSELLGSTKMNEFIESLKQVYDYIILDTPPVIMVTDAQVLAQHADGCLLVVSSGEANREAAIKAKSLLEKVNAKILGVVLNKIDIAKSEYYNYYSNYYYDDDNRKKRKKLKN